MLDINTRRYPRTLAEAFPFDADYACAVTRPMTRKDWPGERLAGLGLAIVIGACLAAALVNWWAS